MVGFKPIFEEMEKGIVQRKQMATSEEGSSQVNAFCLSFRKLKQGEGEMYPSENRINTFLKEQLLLDVRKIYSVTSLKGL